MGIWNMYNSMICPERKISLKLNLDFLQEKQYDKSLAVLFCKTGNISYIMHTRTFFLKNEEDL
jgi:hypothetical protein